MRVGWFSPRPFNPGVQFFQWISLYTRLHLIYRKVKKDLKRFEYMDLALEPVTDNETKTRELFQSEEAQRYVVQIKRLKNQLRRNYLILKRKTTSIVKCYENNLISAISFGCGLLRKKTKRLMKFGSAFCFVTQMQRSGITHPRLASVRHHLTPIELN